jgi:hypothetical protein
MISPRVPDAGLQQSADAEAAAHQAKVAWRPNPLSCGPFFAEMMLRTGFCLAKVVTVMDVNLAAGETEI